MNKALALRVVNTVLFFSFILQAVTVAIILLKIKIPYRELIFEVHQYNGLFMIVLVVMHITLNWGWVKANILKLQAAKRDDA